MNSQKNDNFCKVIPDLTRLINKVFTNTILLGNVPISYAVAIPNLFSKRDKDSKHSLLLSLRKQGIKQYTSGSKYQGIDHINENVCAIFATIIEKYPKEYNCIITIQPNDKVTNKYQCLFWNLQDIMPIMLQFLTLKDLTQCSLVSGHLLYIASNPSCIVSVNLSQRLYRLASTWGCYQRKEDPIFWQRIAKVKNVISNYNEDRMFFYRNGNVTFEFEFARLEQVKSIIINAGLSKKDYTSNLLHAMVVSGMDQRLERFELEMYAKVLTTTQMEKIFTNFVECLTLINCNYIKLTHFGLYPIKIS